MFRYIRLPRGRRSSRDRSQEGIAGGYRESSSPEAPAHPPMQRSTSGRREERQGYCWYAPCKGPSTFHWQLNWLRSARGAMVPWGFATTVILRPPVLEVDLAYLQPGRELDRDGDNRALPHCRGNGAWPHLRDENQQWEVDSSTNANSACLLPRHVRQRSWPSPSARQWQHQKRMGDTLSEARPNSSLQRCYVKFARCNVVFKKTHPWMLF